MARRSTARSRLLTALLPGQQVVAQYRINQPGPQAEIASRVFTVIHRHTSGWKQNSDVAASHHEQPMGFVAEWH